MRRDRDRGDAELLSAYVDGVAELSLDERKRVDDLLARDPALRADEAAARELLGQLRDLPPVGSEPDWAALERSIGDAVGRDVPVPWYQRLRWRFIVPVLALGAAAAILVLVVQPPETAPLDGPIVRHALPAPAPVAPNDTDLTVPLWLDGSSLEVALDAIDPFELEWELAIEGPVPATAELLPPTDLAWVDELDSEALDVVEDMLDAPPAPHGGPS